MVDPGIASSTLGLVGPRPGTISTSSAQQRQKWEVPEIGVGFSIINQPAMGVAPFKEIPKLRKHSGYNLLQPIVRWVKKLRNPPTTRGPSLWPVELAP